MSNWNAMGTNSYLYLVSLEIVNGEAGVEEVHFYAIEKQWYVT